jgi:cobalamin biosynthetic protein CobC
MSTMRMDHGGALAAACRLYGGKPEDWLDLSTGINPNPVALPPIPPAAWARLPDGGLVEAARKAAGRHYGTDVLPLPVPGTQAAIRLVPRLTVPGKVAVVGPTYSEHAASFAACGWQVADVGAPEEIGEDFNAAVIVNPNNPDGRRWRRGDLLGLADRLSARGGFLVVDEAFADLVPENSVAAEADQCAGLIVLRSFGKTFGLAGLRLGFVIAARGHLERLDTMMGPWAVSGPALAIAAGLLANEAVLADVRRSVAARSAAMRAVLDDAGVSVVGEAGLFFLIAHENATGLHDALCRRHVLTRRFDYRSDWLRIGLASDAAAEARLGTALTEALRESGA